MLLYWSISLLSFSLQLAAAVTPTTCESTPLNRLSTYQFCALDELLSTSPDSEILHEGIAVIAEEQPEAKDEDQKTTIDTIPIPLDPVVDSNDPLILSPTPTTISIDPILYNDLPSPVESVAHVETHDESEPEPETPELLSFNEWKVKFVTEPDSSHSSSNGKTGGTERKKERGVHNGSREEQDGITGATEGVEGGSAHVERGNEGAVDRGGGESEEERENGQEEREGAKTNEISPIQPLPDVGSGGALDPLLKLKDRSNFALFDCSAQVHRSSPQSKGASSILVEKKDRYMLTPCQAEKFVEVELCDEIRIDTIVLANFEFFSSMFKHFSIKVSMHYPGRVDEWHDLGTFRARNIRGVQVFNPKPLAGWYRYMRIDFLTHYGSEYYCPVSLLRVYGATQLEAYRLDAEKDAIRDAELLAIATAGIEGSVEVVEVADERVDEAVHIEVEKEGTATTTSDDIFSDSSIFSPADSPPTVSSVDPADVVVESATTPIIITSTDPPSTVKPDQDNTAAAPVLSQQQPTPLDSATHSSTPLEDDNNVPRTTPTESSSDSIRSSIPIHSISIEAPSPSVIDIQVSATAVTVSPYRESPHPTSDSASATSTIPAPSVRATHTTAEPILRTHTRNESRPVTTLLSVPQAQPGDSIYGTIMKRLTSLEQSSNLATQYMDAQSAMLRDLLSRLDRRLVEVEGSRDVHSQVVKNTLSDLQRDRTMLEEERETLAFKLDILEQEMRFERRLGIAQLLSLLALFFFVAVTRGSTPLFNYSTMTDKRRREVEMTRDERWEQPRRENEGPRRTPRPGITSAARGLPNRRFSTVNRTVPRRQYSANRTTVAPKSALASTALRPSLVAITNLYTPPAITPADAPLSSKSLPSPPPEESPTKKSRNSSGKIDLTLDAPPSSTVEDIFTPTPLDHYSHQIGSLLDNTSGAARYRNRSSASLPLPVTIAPSSPLLPLSKASVE